MGSIFFQFYYDDGSNRPFDAEIAIDADTSHFEALEVTADGLIDIFLLKKKDLSVLGLTDAALLPAFILDFDPKAKDHGLGAEENVWYENMTIPVNPIDLKTWAEKWLEILQGMSEEQIKEVMVYNWKYVGGTIDYLKQIAEQAECAMAHKVGIMLYVAW